MIVINLIMTHLELGHDHDQFDHVTHCKLGHHPYQLNHDPSQIRS